MKSRTALLSAYDKTGLEAFARQLKDRGWNLLGSAGTAKHLNGHAIPTRDVAEIVGPPILGHRVVTLSREIHAALLAQNKPEDQAELDRIGIPRIDLVYVNLYPLKQAVSDPDCSINSVLEKTDIGGPTMLRSAGKGRRIVLFDPQQFPLAIEMIDGKFDHEGYARYEARLSLLFAEAEQHLAEYSALSAEFHRKVCEWAKEL